MVEASFDVHSLDAAGMPLKARRAPLGPKLGWAVGAAGPSLMTNLQSTSILFFVVSVLHVGIGVAASLLFVSKIYDIVLNPLMGAISDRTDTRIGRRRPYLLVGAAIAGAAILCLFNIPQTWSEPTRIAALMGSLLLFSTGFTAFNVPFLAIAGEMTASYHERSVLMSLRNVFSAMGLFMGLVVAPNIIGRHAPASQNFSLLGGAAAVFVVVMMVVAFITTRRLPIVDTRQAEKLAPGRWFATLASNIPFVSLLGAKFLALVSTGVTSGSLLFFISYVLKDNPKMAAVFGFFVTCATVACLPFWLYVARRISKKHTLMVCWVGSATSNLSWLLSHPGEPTWALGLRGLANGFFAGGALMVIYSMLADVMEYDQIKTGARREGAFAGLFSLTEKLAFSLAPLIVGAVLSSAGLIKALKPGHSQPASVTHALYTTIAVLPACLLAVTFLCTLAYRLDEKDLTAAALGKTA